MQSDASLPEHRREFRERQRQRIAAAATKAKEVAERLECLLEESEQLSDRGRACLAEVVEAATAGTLIGRRP